MENERLSGAGRTLVPNRFRVYLHPDDLAEFGDMSGALAAELADGALSFARAHRYTLVDRPRVELVANRHLDRAEVRVDTRFADRPAAAAPAQDDEPGGDQAVEPDAIEPPASTADVRPRSDTAIFSVARPEAPAARLRIIRADGTQREIEAHGGRMTIGRARDNDLVLDDGKVSRHHARVMPRHGTLVFTDLGSTNGSWVNGARVAEVALGEGDQIEIGETVLVVESVAGADD